MSLINWSNIEIKDQAELTRSISRFRLIRARLSTQRVNLRSCYYTLNTRQLVVSYRFLGVFSIIITPVCQQKTRYERADDLNTLCESTPYALWVSPGSCRSHRIPRASRNTSWRLGQIIAFSIITLMCSGRCWHLSCARCDQDTCSTRSYLFFQSMLVVASSEPNQRTCQLRVERRQMLSRKFQRF